MKVNETVCCWLKEAKKYVLFISQTLSYSTQQDLNEWISMECNIHTLHVPVCVSLCVCLLKVSYSPASWQIPLALLTYSKTCTCMHTHTNKHTHIHTQKPVHISYCQDCVYVEADNTTDLNPSTCDFLQTGLVPVSPLNSCRNAGKSWAAGWSTGHGPNPLFHVLNMQLLLSKWTALLECGYETPSFLTCKLFSMLPCGQKSNAEYMHDLGAHSTSERPAVRKTC